MVCHEHFELWRSRHSNNRVICTHLDDEKLKSGWQCSDCAKQRDARTRFIDQLANGCWKCRAARIANYERSQRTDTIDPSQPYGEHIPLLCFNHQGEPHLSWHTKNISAGRSIFFNGWGHRAECSCPGYLLFSPGRFIYKLCYLLGTDNCRPYGGG